MLRADVYCRVSTLKDAQQDSIIHQQEKGEMVAQELGATVENIYVDEGKSGTEITKRSAYQRMLNDIEKKRIDIIITKDVDRLNRNTKDFNDLLDLAVKNDVKIYFYLTGEYYNPYKDTLVKIKGVLSEDYSKNLSMKSKEAHANRQKSGRSVIFTNNTWGYKVRYSEDGKKQLVVDDKEAEMINIIFNLCIQGFGVHKIAKRLYSMGYTNRNGNIFSNGVIANIIKNPKVIGTAIFNQRTYDFGKKKTIHNPENEWIIKENVVPPIVSPETFLMANAMLENRKIEIDNSFDEKKVIGYFAGSSKLNGKIICGACGDKYSKQARKLGNGSRVYDWKCNRHIKYGRKTENQYQRNKSKKIDVRLENGCDNPTVKQEVIYKIVQWIAKEYFGTDNKLVEKALSLLRISIDNAREKSNQKKEIENLEKRISGLNGKINSLIDKMVDGVITKKSYDNAVGSYEKNRDDLEEQLFRIKKEYGKLQDTERRINEIQCLLEKGGIEEASINTTLEYIDKIYVFSDRFEITFHMDRILGIDNKVLCEVLAKEGKVVYYIDKEDMKYKRQAMDKTNEIIYNAIKEDNKISIAELAYMSGLSMTTVHFRIKRFKQLGYIGHPSEKGRMREWEVLKAWNPEDNQKLVIRPEKE